MTVYRCKMGDCGKVLFEADLTPGSVIVKICPNCKVENRFEGPKPAQVGPKGKKPFQERMAGFARK